MMKTTTIALVAAAAMATQVAMPRNADAQYYGAPNRQDRGAPPEQYRQGFQDGYKSGYRAGTDASRSQQRYDDTDYSYGYGYNAPSSGFSSPGYNNGTNVSN